MKLQQTPRLIPWAALPLFLTLALVMAAALPATAPVVGDWQGALDTGNGSLRVVIHVTQDSSGKLAGTMDSPDQGATGIAIPTLTFQAPDFHFEIPRLSASYDGQLSKDGSQIAGQWKQGSVTLPLTFKRSGK